MTDPSLFGIAKPHWDMINGFANWFSALGSFAAAFVALYLSNRAAKPSAKISVGLRILIHPDSGKSNPEFAVFHIVNTGDRPIQVKQIGWKVGLFRKQFAVQIYDPSQSSNLPIELTHGQEASWYIPLSAKEKPWLEYFAKVMLLPHSRTALWTLRGRIFTSVGYMFETRLEKSLMIKLKESCEKLQRSADVPP